MSLINDAVEEFCIIIFTKLFKIYIWMQWIDIEYCFYPIKLSQNYPLISITNNYQCIQILEVYRMVFVAQKTWFFISLCKISWRKLIDIKKFFQFCYGTSSFSFVITNIRMYIPFIMFNSRAHSLNVTLYFCQTLVKY